MYTKIVQSYDPVTNVNLNVARRKKTLKRYHLLWHVENMIMMINNAAMSFNFALAQKENTTCKDQSKSMCK